MEIIALGLGAALLVGLFYAVGVMLGFPMERQKTVDARQEYAAKMRENAINAEAARNLEVRAAEERLQS